MLALIGALIVTAIGVGPWVMYDPESMNRVVDDAFGIVAGIFDPVASGIKGVISWLWDAISYAVQQATDFAGELFSQIVDLVSIFMDQAEEWFEQALDYASQVKDWIWSYVDSIFLAIWDEISNLTAKLAHLALAGITDLVSLAADLWTHFVQPIVELVGELIAQAFGDLLGWVRDVVTGMLSDILDVGGELWDFLRGLVTSIVDDLLNGVDGVLDVIHQAWDWLVYFATHPFSWFGDLIDGFFHDGAKWLMERVTSAMRDEGSVFEDWAVSWLGMVAVIAVACWLVISRPFGRGGRGTV